MINTRTGSHQSEIGAKLICTHGLCPTPLLLPEMGLGQVKQVDTVAVSEGNVPGGVVLAVEGEGLEVWVGQYQL